MKNILIAIMILSVTSFPVIASPVGSYDAGVMNRQYIQDLRVHEAITRSAQSRNAIVTNKVTQKTEADIINCDINEVLFTGNFSIPSNELQTVIKDKLKKQMNPENITAIRKNVMKYYQERGYFSALATVVNQDTQNGVLTIDIKEGGRNSIIIE